MERGFFKKAGLILGTVGALAVGGSKSEAQTNDPAQQKTENVISVEDIEEIVSLAHENGPGVVFEKNGKAYVLVIGKSRDMQMSIDKAQFNGRIILAKYLDVTSLLESKAVQQKPKRTEEGQWESEVVMSAPIPTK